MSFLTEEEALSILIEEMRKVLPDLLANLSKTKDNIHLSEEERECSVAAYDTLNSLGTDYSDEELKTAWEQAHTHMKTLSGWGSYW